MRARRTAAILLGAALGLGACTSAADKAGDAADAVAEGAVAKLAVGRWRCETEQVEGGTPKHITTNVAIGEDGAFSYEVVGGDDGPLSGTWAIDDLQVSASIPWQDDGRNGFENWQFGADADPPTHIDGRSSEGAVQDLDIGIEGKDRITIHQDDDGGEIGGVGYAWDVTCERTSSDPGDIGPTVPASGTSGGD